MGNVSSIKAPTLIDLIKQNQEKQALQLMKAGASPHTISSNGFSALRLALEMNQPALFRMLWEGEAQIVPELPNLQTPLHYAVVLNHYSMAWMLLREHSTFPSFKNKKDAKGCTPLHVAVQTSNPDMVALLLKYNVDRFVLDCKGRTPYELALESFSPLAEEIIEQFTMEDCLAKEKSISQAKEQGSTQGTSEEEVSHFLLEKALLETRVPVIRSQEFDFLEVMSGGSSCLVFKGLWRSTEVAIKQFKVEYTNSEKDLQKFVKELMVLAQVRHPNLVLLMGVSVDQPNLCIITEYVPNHTLFYQIHKNKTRKLSISEKFFIGIQIARALAYLHHNNPPIVHRDLKPENCLLDKGFNLKLADFGLARPLSAFSNEAEMTTVCIGTTRFMAPELFDRTNSVGTEVDVWAFGCVLVELFSGKRPWHYIPSSKSNCICYEVFNKKPLPIPQTVPPEIREAVQECCNYNPSKRPNIQQVLDKLELAKSSYT